MATRRDPTPKDGERILIISPVKDEGEYIEQTIHSMAWQTLRPAKWIIVNDGSSDNTGELAEQAAAEYDWIEVLHRPAGTKRRVGPGVIEAFYAGLDTDDMHDYDFVCKLDGDIVLPHFYFERMMQQFQANPRLGTASGKAYIPVDGELVLERTGDEFSHGIAKLFRVECFEEIGGFVRQVMWDGIDCHRCRMLGWDAVSYGDADLAIIHLRIMGSSHKSVFKGRRRWGFGQYFMGTHPLYMLAIAAYRMAERPWILGGLCLLQGYFGSMLRRDEQYGDLKFRKHLRRWQMQKLGDMFLRRKRPAERFKLSPSMEAALASVREFEEQQLLAEATELASEAAAATRQGSTAPAETNTTVQA